RMEISYHLTSAGNMGASHKALLHRRSQEPGGLDTRRPSHLPAAAADPASSRVATSATATRIFKGPIPFTSRCIDIAPDKCFFPRCVVGSAPSVEPEQEPSSARVSEQKMCH